MMRGAILRGEEHYLGDAVYASFDGYQIWLRTSDGSNNLIALEPPVFHKLVEFQALIIKALTPEPGELK